MFEFDRILYRRFANTINKENGITLSQDLTEVRVSKGYFVSIAGITRILPNRNEQFNTSWVSSHDIEVCFNELANKYGILGLIGYVGFWKDGITLYADITLHVQSKKLALLIGFICKQKAIFDCKNSAVINL